MGKMMCTICGYVYDEAVGDPARGIPPGTKWEDVPEDWVCPLCGAAKADFSAEQASKTAEKAGEQATNSESHDPHDWEEERELSSGELSALYSNLAKGCEKQYRFEVAELFHQLVQYYQRKNPAKGEGNLAEIMALLEKNLDSEYGKAKLVAEAVGDRGSLRALTWGEKASKILAALLKRYEKEHDKMLENAHIYVCEICGFIYIGDEVPAVCPVCKVPKQKILEIRRG